MHVMSHERTEKEPGELGMDEKKMIFTFGSNLSGWHGSGSAAHAMIHCGAIHGQGEGLQGTSYALPTVGKHIRKMSFERVKKYVKNFIEYAEAHPELEFKVTQVGCKRAGFTTEQIAPLFINAPGNCYFDTAWKEFLGDSKKFWGTYA